MSELIRSTISFPADLDEQCRIQAKALGLSYSAFFQQIAREHLEQPGITIVRRPEAPGAVSEPTPPYRVSSPASGTSAPVQKRSAKSAVSDIIEGKKAVVRKQRHKP